MTDLLHGLSESEAARLTREGRANGGIDVPTKSIAQIVRTNTLTFFNLLNVILAVAVLLVGSPKNALFMGVIISNTAIGIFQEIRAKRTIDKLSLISAPKATVIREGREKQIAVGEIVLGDICVLSAGMQICADGLVREGELEVNESLVTGESDPVSKSVGDRLLSGSFVVCGGAKAEIDRVGKESFAGKIAGGARYLKKNNSKMFRAINTIIKGISIFIVPIAALLLLKSLFLTGEGVNDAIIGTVAAVIGMIPEGLVLLASIVLAVSVVRLSKHNTLVQELYCIETLARVDVLCLDKTGTITEGAMCVEKVERLSDFDLDKTMNALMTALSDNNPTFSAMKERWGERSDISAVKVLPFSSAKKWSGAELSGMGSYIVGAAEFILRGNVGGLKEKIEPYSADGRRVLLLARSEAPFDGKNLPNGEITPLALIIIGDKIRAEAPATLAFFAEQGVDLKIISGDNPVTVASIARRAGLKYAGKWVDASTITDIDEAADKYSVFGRVTPEQKLALVKALQKKGHTVGMTGDGVNDVLALKEADCSVAMQSGSDAARSVSNLVLLDSNFASMPKIVAEGRRSINNIERSASLFLSKTVYAFLLALMFVLIQMPYPFIPIQMTLVSSLTIGLPSFLLALQQNTNLVRGSFIENVMKIALPQGVIAAGSLGLLMLISSICKLSEGQTSACAVAVLGFTSLILLWRLCRPFNKRKITLFLGIALVFSAAVVLSGLGGLVYSLFSIEPFSVTMLLVCLGFFALILALEAILPRLLGGLVGVISGFFGRRRDRAGRK